MAGLWDTIWNGLQDANTREIIGWVGGGVAAVAGGFWVAFTYFRDNAKKGASPAPATQVTASGGSVAVAGSVNAPITITTPLEPLAPVIAAAVNSATLPLAALNA